MAHQDFYQPSRVSLAPQDFESLTIPIVANRFLDLYPDDRERARAVHDFVRKHIHYGFCLQFDSASATHTLHHRLGHATAQAKLMIELLKATGFEVYPHFVMIRKNLLYGLLPKHLYEKLPDAINHCYIEALVAKKWSKLDSYVLDDELIKQCKNRLIGQEWGSGYGLHPLATNFWDGKSDAFSQCANPDRVLEDHGRWDSHKAYFSSRKYPYKFMGMTYSTWFQMGFPSQIGLWIKQSNDRISRIRQNLRLAASY